MTERSEGAADKVGVAAKRPNERSEGAADKVGVAAKRPNERSEGAADKVGVAAKRPNERSEDAADKVGVAAERPSILAEIKRRKVFRVAVVYAATAFVILQAADIMLPRLAVPEWAMTLVVVLTVLGFPIALVLAWALELTPDGIKRAEAARSGDNGEATPALLGKHSVLASALLVAVGLGLSAGWLLKPDGSTSVESASVAEPDAAAALARSDDPRPSEVTPAAEKESIAVLPFVNMSPDPENAYFADGISEELLNILAGIDGLKVASRTSAFSFKGTNTPIPEIARQLGVRHVLEGSVRKQGNRVRITAQLIEAGDDAHLWSERYDRDLDDIFQVQEEIAQAITLALEDILGTRQIAVEAPTRDMAAYQRYLHGRSRFYQRFELDQAVDDLRFAVERDPQFAEAWAFLAATYWVIGNTGYATEHIRSDMARLAGPAVDRAMALKSDMPIMLALKGRIILGSNAPDRIAEGIRLMERAVALPGPDTTPKLWLALLWLELGYVDRALPLMESARRQDPLVGVNLGALGTVQAIEGRRAEAVALVLQAVELDGLAVWGNQLATDQFYAGDRAGAAELIAAMLPLFSDRFASDRARASGLLNALRDPARAQDYLQKELASDRLADTFALSASLIFDRGASAFELVETGRSSTWVIINSAWLPAMRWLREDPRYFRMMERNGRVEYWDTYGYPRGCSPVDGPDGRHLSCPEQP